MTSWEKIQRALGLSQDSTIAAELRQEALDRLAHSLLVSLKKDAGETGFTSETRRARIGGPRGGSGWRYSPREPLAGRMTARASTLLRLVDDNGDGAPDPRHVAIAEFETPQGRCRLLEGKGVVFVEFWDEIAPKTLTLSGMPYDLKPELYSLKWTGEGS